MTFLQPLILAALPLIALPILIHLINQRRYQTIRSAPLRFLALPILIHLSTRRGSQTIRWAAMLFLLAANRMSRGYARLRQWLILAFRMAVIAGLVFAISRPPAGGWVGVGGGNRGATKTGG